MGIKEEDFVDLQPDLQPKKVVMAFTVRDLDLLRMSLTSLYTHYSVCNTFSPSLSDKVYGPILAQINELYWRICKVM